MKLHSRASVRLGAALALTILAAGCSTKSQAAASMASDGVKTDIGVTDNTITLGAISATSGPYASGGLAITHGNELWAKEVNASGGICGRDVKLDIVDSAYKADNAVPLYDKMKQSSLAIVQLLGSPIVAALKAKVVSDNMPTVIAGWSSINLDAPQIMLVGSTLDVDSINALAYLQSQGTFADGDALGIVYLDSEAGQNALLGAQYYAQEHNLSISSVPVSPTDSDMTASMTKLKQDGVKAILVQASPAALGSVALQNVAQGMNVPIVAMSSAYVPNLYQDPATASALEQVIVAQPFIPYSSDEPIAQQIRAAYDSAGYTDPPAQFVMAGYGSGLLIEAVLKQACEDGDLTRAGLMAAREKLSSVDMQGITGPLDLSVPGAPPARDTVFMKPEQGAPGGATLIEANVSSPEAEQYKAPNQK